MSLILEALKKSEAERRLGQVPGLMTPVQRTTPRRDSRGPLLFALLLAIVASVAAGWWWMQREKAASAAARRSETTPATSAPSNPPPTSGAVDATSTPAATAVPPARTPAAVLPAELPSDPDFVSRERESRPVAPNTPPPIDAAPPASRTPPQAPAASAPRPRIAPPAPDATATPARAAPASASPPAAPDGAQMPPATEEVLERLPRLADLSAGERDVLPPLKLTMHVYATDPAARFVLIDGQRLGQGERLSPALTLTEIRRDGAVFEFDGRRFLIPRL